MGRTRAEHAAELAPGAHEQRIDETQDDDAGDDFREADADRVGRGAGGQDHGCDELYAVEARQQREAHRERVKEEGKAASDCQPRLVRRSRSRGRAGTTMASAASDGDPERGESLQCAGEVAGDDGGDERADPDSAVHPEAEHGRDQQEEGT